MPEHTRRLFFALWPDNLVRTRCDWYAAALLGKRVRRVPAENLLGEPHKGFYALMHHLAEERLISAC